MLVVPFSTYFRVKTAVTLIYKLKCIRSINASMPPTPFQGNPRRKGVGALVQGYVDRTIFLKKVIPMLMDRFFRKRSTNYTGMVSP